MTLKRVLPGVASQHGKIKVSDTRQNAADLDWFMYRHPLEMSAEDRAYLQKRASEHREGASAVAGIVSGRIAPQPFELAIPARDYQKVAASVWLRQGHLLLGDQVGLGKSASAICGLTNPKTRPALIVTMTHLPLQWQREIARFAPSLRTRIIRNGKPYDLTEPVLPGVRQLPDVVITSYSKLSSWAETLAKVGFASLILDECQELRRAKAKPSELTQKYAAAKHIAAGIPFRIGLSATPVYGYGSECFNIMQILDPGCLGSKREFAEEWCTHDGDGKPPRIKYPRVFGSYMREAGLMLRRTREDVGRELPPIQRIQHYVDCDTSALDEISGRATELARIILRQNENKPGEKFMASEELSNQLRQATGLGKARFVADFVRMLVENGEKVVLYGWHRSVYAVWMEQLADLGAVLYSGSESATQKDEARRKFVDGYSKVLIISLRSGAGLDGLQNVSRTVVIGELDWSPGVLEQNEGRVYRDGQRDPVLVYYLVADHGADPIMSDVLGIKKAQSDGIRDPNADILERLQQDPGHVKRLAEDFLKQRGHRG